MSYIHDSTLLPDDSGSSVGGVPRIVPALTVLWHPDLTRVGEIAVLDELTTQRSVAISRLGPRFRRPGDEAERELADLYLSRTPAVELVPGARGQIEIKPGPAKTEVEIQGAPLERSVTLAPAEVDAGVVFTVGRIALCLHNVRLPMETGGNLGLVGNGQGLERVRQDVRRVADLEVPVLIRGETGTGKELVARSIVACSRRAKGPFVAVNMATIPASVAAAELFGHERGAFTGAAGARAGYFGEAAGGTLFLDEVGLTPPDVQAMLLRVLETGEIQPLGSGRVRKLDVRVLAATDARLESEIGKRAFSEPLFQRLAGFQIRIPPLRKRREDFGQLFLHFLREELAVTGELDRLASGDDRKPWISASTVAQLANGSWSGNVRALRNAARQIVIASRGQVRARIDEEVEALAEGTLEDTAPRPVVETRSPRVFRPTPTTVPVMPVADDGAALEEGDGSSGGMPWEISDELLLETLRRNNWSPTATAAALKIPRTKLYVLMERHPDIRKASDVPVADLLRLHREVGGDLDEMANRLRVSRRGLQLRMSQVLAPGTKTPPR